MSSIAHRALSARQYLGFSHQHRPDIRPGHTLCQSLAAGAAYPAFLVSANAEHRCSCQSMGNKVDQVWSNHRELCNTNTSDHSVTAAPMIRRKILTILMYDAHQTS